MTRLTQLLFAALLAACGTPIVATARADRGVALQSPDGKVHLQLQVAADGNQVLFSVARDGKPIVESSPLDVQVAGVGWIARDVSVLDIKQRTIDETSDLPWGKTSRLHNHCSAATVRLRGARGIEWDIELRAYDDGVALRYGFPEQERLRELTIEDEATEFRFAGDPTVLFLPLDNFTTSHEGLYERKRMSELPADKLIEMPLLVEWPDGTAAAVTEARLRGFAGMYLERRVARPKPTAQGVVDDAAATPRPSLGAQGVPPSSNVLRSRLSPLPDTSNACVIGRTPLWSPWRVILLGSPAGKLIESNLLLCLNDNAEGDFSWVKPGKTTFHWWTGTVEHGPASTPDVNFATHKMYIDFCARNKIAYHSVISVSGNWPWFVQRDPGFDPPHADADILTPRPDLDLPRILAYAKEKGVGIRFWVPWKPLSEKLEEALAQYERWGVKGLMVDFMDRDDQEMVEWQEKVLQAAAKHKLHVQFHGSYKPSGEQRTFPNMFNREGVLNLEYLKWSDSCAPPHSVNVAYTRLLAGPVDYHLGGFRAATRDQFQPRDEKPSVLGTRCYLLAMYVVYENPMPMVADLPSAYEGEPGFDFIVDVPTTWDETRFVAGEAGEYVVVARRKGANWYLGGITNWTKRELTIPLEFLGAGTYIANLYRDGSLDEEQPNAIRLEQREVSAAAPLRVSLAPGGGIAAVFRPK